MGYGEVRFAARVILLDEEGRVLLFRIPAPPHRPGLALWSTPGGGIEVGEEAAAAAARELWEETGLRDTVIGPEIWTRSYQFEIAGERTMQHERYFFAKATAFEPSRENLEAHELDFITSHRWWTAEEIAASSDYFIPRALGKLLPALIRGEFPASPIDCGT